MNETMICAVGNVATQPVFRQLANGGSLRFRLAVTARYWDREKSAWTDGHTNFFTVWANRQLAGNASGSLAVGDPVVVQGRLKVRTDVREGQSRTSADIDAVAIGHDLARGTAAFRRTGRVEASTSPPQPEPNWEVPAGESPGESPGESSGGPVVEHADESVAQPTAPATPEQRPEPVPVG
ncbi:single-stranded DNA-binding protein [Streptomyces tendae]|uniref:single-stranded DNA-binding protein n=1 Tax=Streptomyces tendae TaxID=1932 RepID=UPI0037FE475E